jgi:hypothetical protein
MNKILTANHRSNADKSEGLTTLKSLDNFKIFFLLAITIWIAYFWHSASFGMYSEDMGFVGDAMEGSWSGAIRQFLNQFRIMPEGRPLQFGLIPLLSFIGFKLGGLQVVYWIAYVILAINSFLFYALLKRLSDREVFAVTGALAFALFPAHTVQIWLTAALSIQPALTLFLIASHCYLSEKKKLSYSIIFASLFCYETFFPVFLAVPLLKKKWNSKLIRELLAHILVMAVLFICAIIIRKLTGESRIANLDPFSAIIASFRSMVIGPVVMLTTFLSRPLETLTALVARERDLMELWLFLPLSFAGFVWLLSNLKLVNSSKKPSLATTTLNQLPVETNKFFNPSVKLTLVGIVMSILAYPFIVKHSTTVVNDLVSRIHVAAAIGGSILCACACSAILFLANTYRIKRVAVVFIAGFFALLVGFGIMVQQDYRLAWQYQRAFLSDVVRLAPDLDDETILFIDPTGFRDPEYLKAFQTGYPMLQSTSQLSKIYSAISAPSRNSKWFNAYILMSPNWQEIILAKENLLQLDRSMKSTIWGRFENDGLRTFASSQLILLEANNGKLTRRIDPLVIDGRELPLKMKPATSLPLLENAPIYDYLIQSPDEEPIDYINEITSLNKL